MQLPVLEYDRDAGAEPGERSCGISNGHESQNVLFLTPEDKTSISRVPPATHCDVGLIWTQREQCHLLGQATMATSAPCAGEGYMR